MRVFPYRGDDRLKKITTKEKKSTAICIYCGGIADSKEHVPSKVFLDEPYPQDLPTVPACIQCNNGFSNDERYAACIIDLLYSLEYLNGEIRRAKTRNIIVDNPHIEEQILFNINSLDAQRLALNIDSERLKRIIIKLAIGHLAYECAELLLDKPEHIGFAFLASMSDEMRARFECVPSINIYPEIGCRFFNRVLCDGENSWVVIQEERYRYLVDIGSELRVRIVIGEVLFAEVIWL